MRQNGVWTATLTDFPHVHELAYDSLSTAKVATDTWVMMTAMGANRKPERTYPEPPGHAKDHLRVMARWERLLSEGKRGWGGKQTEFSSKMLPRLTRSHWQLNGPNWVLQQQWTGLNWLANSRKWRTVTSRGGYLRGRGWPHKLSSAPVDPLITTKWNMMVKC